MINKFQQGGRQQDAIMQFVQGLAETLQADPNQIVEIAQQNPEALKSAVQVYQETQDMNKAAQAFQQVLQAKTRAMKHGAKLQYLKSLKNQCAEDEELIYYKRGGSIDCGCVKKQDGGKTPQKAQKAEQKFKEVWTKRDEQKLDSLTSREAKKLPLTNQGKKDLKALREKFKNSSNQKDYELEEGKCGMKVKKNACGNKIVKKACGSKCEAVAKFKAARCGAKMKKHQQGGSLNGIPFIRMG